MTRAGRKTDAVTTLLMVLLILTAVKLLLERLLALMLPHDLHQNTRLLLSMAQEALLIGLPALLMRRGRSARTGTMRLSIGLLLCAAVLGLAMRALATPLTQLWGNFVSAPDSQIAAADSAGEWCLQLLALAVLPAVLEEALFRGVVLQTLLDSGSRFGAWLLTTLFFSLLHGNLAALPAHLLFGGALTLAAMRTGNLLVPMVMHAVYNASALFWRGMSSGWLIFCGAAALALGIPLKDSAAVLAGVPHVQGRVEVIPTPGKDYTILIDYAHTPDSMVNVLRTVKEFAKGRTVAVFGCGGARSRLRRFGMGSVCARLADFCIITEDNSRGEPVEHILADIRAGLRLGNPATPFAEIPDRRQAIYYALDHAQPGDIIAILGKGHETTIERGGIKEPFVEREIVEEYWGR